jgi:hypothetical protein
MPPQPEVAFAEIANGFCAWCEEASLGNEPEASAAAAAWLSKLHAAAIGLPQVESENEDDLPGMNRPGFCGGPLV